MLGFFVVTGESISNGFGVRQSCAGEIATATDVPVAEPGIAETAEPDAAPPAVAPAVARTRTVKIALLVPLSGRNAALGRAMLDAAQMALFDAADENTQLVPRDTEGTPEGARRAVRTALDAGVSAILGPVTAPEVSAVAPLAKTARVPVIAFSSDAGVAGEGVYLMGLLPRDQVKRVVAFAISQGRTRFAILAPTTAYGEAVTEALREAAAIRGGQIVRVETYDPDARDLAPIVKRLAKYDERHNALLALRAELERRQDDPEAAEQLRALRGRDTYGDVEFDAILLAEGGAKLRALAPLLPFFDIDPDIVRVLGTGLWEGQELGVEPALVGGWYAAPSPETWRRFENAFRDAYREKPPRLATLAYDAMSLAAYGARARKGGDFSHDVLASPNGFSGIDGIFRFVPGNVTERGLAVLEIRPRGIKIVAAAPKSFAASGE